MEKSHSRGHEVSVVVHHHLAHASVFVAVFATQFMHVPATLIKVIFASVEG